MAQAFRSRKHVTKALNSNQSVLKGTYEVDKTVVEWERLICIDEVTRIIQRLPYREYEKSELRFYISGYLQGSDHHLPDSKFRDYRISGESLNLVLDILEANETLTKSGNNEDSCKWEPKKAAVQRAIEFV